MADHYFNTPMSVEIIGIRIVVEDKGNWGKLSRETKNAAIEVLNSAMMEIEGYKQLLLDGHRKRST